MAREIRIIASDLEFPEGPVAMADGAVLVAEVRSGKIKRISKDGETRILADCGGGPNGLAIGPDGALYVCNNGGNTYRADHFAGTGPAPDYKGGSIQRVDLDTGAVSVLYTHCNERRLSSPNDLVFDAHGGFYFSDFGKRHADHRDHGGLYYAQPDGGSITELAYPAAAPNGVALSPDQAVLYVAETEAARVWAYDIDAPGALRKHDNHMPNGARLICGLPGYQRFDSMAIDAAGNICVATLVTGVVTVVSPDGRIVDEIKFPDTHVTNLCFGGPGLREAYVTLAQTGRLACLTWPVGGLPLNFTG